MNILTKTISEAKKIGKTLAKQCRGGDIVCLYGDLGTGKTTLTKGMANGFLIKKDITSPTFALMNIYPVKSQKIKQLVHIDTYRLKNEQELIDIGIEDYLGAPDTICIIEWPEKITDLLSKKKVKKVTIKHIDENKRQIELEDNGY